MIGTSLEIDTGEPRCRSGLARTTRRCVSRPSSADSKPIRDSAQVICISSIEELDKLSGCGTLLDIHRDKIDHITIPSQKGNGVLRRVEEVFDCWFESGRSALVTQSLLLVADDVTT